jgi:flagellar hook protein FlgE
MLNSIFVALSGLQAHERALGVVSNNVSNMNTPGFRGSTVTFADVFIGTGPNGSLGGQQSIGGGVDGSRTQVDVRAGDQQATGRGLDLALSADGFFVLQDESGATRFTRNGNFDFDDDGELALLGLKAKVMARTATGQLVPISLKDLRASAAKPTTKVTLDGIISSGDGNGEVILESVSVFDKAGVQHTLRIVFTRQGGTPPPGVSVRWKMTVSEGPTEVGTADVDFFGNDVVAGTSPLQVTLALKDTEPTSIAFDFEEVDGGPFGTESSLQVKEQDGFGAGIIATRTFDAKGVLKITYTNGQSVDGAKLALARIADQDALVQLGDSLLEYGGEQAVDVGEADDSLQVLSQVLEGSNVSLTREFGRLILVQRGYQASSQVMSTASEMMQELLSLRDRR